MKKSLFLLFFILILSGCASQKPVVTVPKPVVVLSDQQLDSYKKQITKLVGKKSWTLEGRLIYSKMTIPKGVLNTYYETILVKSKDSGLDISKYLGQDAVEITDNICYSNGDTAGTGHFLFINEKLIGAYYTVGNNIYSLNEKEVFKTQVEWKNQENINKKANFKEKEVEMRENLITCTKIGQTSYTFSWDGKNINVLSFSDGQFLVDKQITLDGLIPNSIFVGDFDKDKKMEVGILSSTGIVQSDVNAKSKLFIMTFEDKIHTKYSINFDDPTWSADYDGNDIVVTSDKSIEIYSFEGDSFNKEYAYNKVGGIIKVDDIDGSGIPRYILKDSNGRDIYIFERNKDGLEEIWRSYNANAEYKPDRPIQVGDLNSDGVKEIYIEDLKNTTRRIVLQTDGFALKNDDIKSTHTYFLGDFNGDGKFEYFDMFKPRKAKNNITVYRY